MAHAFRDRYAAGYPRSGNGALFSAIGIWNNFFNCLLLVDEAKYYSLQFTIYTTLNNIRFLLENADKMRGSSTLPNFPRRRSAWRWRS
jgi:hypothetical protein